MPLSEVSCASVYAQNGTRTVRFFHSQCIFFFTKSKIEQKNFGPKNRIIYSFGHLYRNIDKFMTINLVYFVKIYPIKKNVCVEVRGGVHPSTFSRKK